MRGLLLVVFLAGCARISAEDWCRHYEAVCQSSRARELMQTDPSLAHDCAELIVECQDAGLLPRQFSEER